MNYVRSQAGHDNRARQASPHVAAPDSFIEINMKKAILLLAAGTLALSTLGTAQAAQESKGCAAKIQNIKADLENARAHKNRAQISGLETALSRTQANCTDASLAKDRADDVAKAQDKVKEREQDLAEAQAKNDKSKIRKATSKLDEARKDLAQAQAEVGK
jgi:hypothetical protein